MISSAPKRRKTSPTSSVQIDSTTPPDPPPAAHQLPGTPLSSKSSTVSRLTLRQVTSNRPEEPPASEPDFPEVEAAITNALTAQAPRPLEDLAASFTDTPLSGANTIDNSTPSAVDRGQAGSPSPLSATRAGRTISNVPTARHRSHRPRPRPLPPPVPETEEDLLHPYIFGPSSLRSPLNTGVLPPVVHPEPQLPPIPHHLDSVVSTPPAGIHKTPTKKLRHGTAEGNSRQRSPSKISKRNGHGPPQKNSRIAQVHHGARRARPPQNIEEFPLVQVSEDQAGVPKTEFAPGTHPRRSIRLNPLVEKERERDALTIEVASLQADLEQATIAVRDAAMGLPFRVDSRDILDLLGRHLVPSKKSQEPDPAIQWLETAMDPMALLGFNGGSSACLPPPVAQKTAEPELPPISHHPIEMSASEELPYLQVFTPLTYTSTSTISDGPAGTIYKNMTISITSAAPPGLFAATIEMTVNTGNNVVVTLTVPRLDPAAATELSWIITMTTVAQPRRQTPLTRNISVLTWAMNEWYRVAIKRAMFWHALEQELGTVDKESLLELVRTMRTRKARRRRAREEADDADGSPESADFEGRLTQGRRMSKTDLLPHMGRVDMDLSVPCVSEDGRETASELRVSWDIGFDWTGNAKSTLSVKLGVPAKWHALDNRKCIAEIPKIFERLVGGGEDPLMAVKTIVALLAGEPAP